MDGNGRWAKERGLARVAGHNQGMKALIEIVRHSSDIGIKYLTVYAFSTENWKRSIDEVSGIFKLFVLYVQSELDELSKNNVKVNILGDISKLPEDAIKAAEKTLKTTENNTGMVFNIAINYGGRAEIIKAVNEAVKEGKEVDEDSFSSLLYTAGMPDPDVIIRTGGEMRISNFLIWQGAYSEYVSSDVYWPDFTTGEYERCLLEYEKRDRRYGGVKA
jgi:undecaprenyl diphosphate synthase